MLNERREGEFGEIPGRCDRFYVFKNEWFFNTREGSPVGPFSTHESAVIGMRDYIDFLILAKPKIKERLMRAMSA